MALQFVSGSGRPCLAVIPNPAALFADGVRDLLSSRTYVLPSFRLTRRPLLVDSAVPSAIRIQNAVVAAISEAARRTPGGECCGLLAGRDGAITQVFPSTNVASDPAKRYEIAPAEIVRLMREMRAAGLEFLGIYHSHPNGENVPSPRDIELAYYSNETYFIISPLPDAPGPVRAFSIRDGRATELTIEIV
jgi:proteasome lid subunit RPN8/RPN11